MWPRTSNVDRSRDRQRMVDQQLRARGIDDPRVIAAFLRIPRERFVDERFAARAYDDGTLPIGFGQTLSQPFVVAVMAEALAIRSTERVLEVGAGSGYAAAVLSQLARHVVAVERHGPLADQARRRLASLGLENVEVHRADGMQGWPSAAPYDAILVSAAGPEVPSALVDQLAVRGRLVMPVGGPGHQDLTLLARTVSGRVEQQALGPVSFVPLVGGTDDGADLEAEPDDGRPMLDADLDEAEREAAIRRTPLDDLDHGGGEGRRR